MIALIPARSGSKRIPHKNIRPVEGHPLVAYAIAAAIASEVFDAVVLSTDSEHYAAIGRHYGAEVPFLRPPELADDSATDIEWVRWTLLQLAAAGRRYDAFSILRPTSPARQASTIAAAWAAFREAPAADSLRAVEPCAQHPGKMWRLLGGRLVPVLPVQPDGTPWHSRPTQSLPPVWVQNASLEIAWSRCAVEEGSIAGEAVVPFVTEGHEGLDLNEEIDWISLTHLLRQGEIALPSVHQEPWTDG